MFRTLLTTQVPAIWRESERRAHTNGDGVGAQKAGCEEAERSLFTRAGP